MRSEGVPGPTTRRGLLAGLGATALGAGCLGTGGGNRTTATERAEFVLATALSGPYAPVGEAERRGFELAVAHLRSGGGYVDGDRLSADGSGVAGRAVAATTVDTGGNREKARTALSGAVGDGTVAVTGGVAGSAARACRAVAEERDVVYLPGSTPLDGLTGRGCSPVVYREGIGATAAVRALGSAVGADLGEVVRYTQLSVDAPGGRSLRTAVDDHFPARVDADWQARGGTTVRPGTVDLGRAVDAVVGTLPDAVFLNLFGLDAVNAVRQLRDAVPGAALLVPALLVPALDGAVAAALGGAAEGLVGTTGWHPGARVQGTNEPDGTSTVDPFAAAYRERHGTAPTGAARTVHVGTLLAADAAERAGATTPEAIRPALEGREFALGLGTERLRACDHTAVRPVPVVRGRAEPGARGGRLETVAVENSVAGCGRPPAANCSL